jgi:hypothetical protein
VSAEGGTSAAGADAGPPAPLDARRFFAGRWRGRGEIVPHGPARLVLARSEVALEGRGEWLGETVWRVHERFTVGGSRGFRFERRMFMEETAPGRVHATADDVPLGAELELDAGGFRFRRFRTWLPYRGVRFRMGCTSDTRVAVDGTLQAVIRLDWLRLPVATLRLEIHVARD